MNDSVMLAELSWPEFADKVKANAPVFLPVGATEQHGPHMGLGVDVVLPTGICERVARNVGGIVAPAIPYGYKSQARSGGGETFSGTISLQMHTLTMIIRDVIVRLGMQGIRRVAVVSGHFENIWPAIEGIDLALKELRQENVIGMTVLRFEPWDFIEKETLNRLFPDGFPGIEFEHAALLETSLMLSLRPDMVDMSKVPTDGPAKFPSYDRYPQPSGYVPPSGVLARAERSSIEKGRLLMDDHVQLIARAVRDGFGL